ncbi:uncharacterized membrane protein YcaP (DUF421 family) [Fontibacillus solani]|uniref:Uncharacterized membrane protein YcaP (DUF421 family) n=1 Tax=Fontibacillus solani TaxID=1572857 RepID=A0A7W3XSU8_9BACL|nr:DUF421 domain-containing protein [Fontibacillus solani]MBA9086900.1 uncharacterized membrane protein YcaP (DUF421 family) [Fontibacillus solani]
MPQWLEVIVRTLVAVVVLFALTKLLGKRQISQLSLFEYITGISIGSITAYISLDVDTDWYLGIIALAVWSFVSFGIEFLQIKSKKARDLIDGKGTILIKDGKILEDNLKKEKLTNEELLEQLRKKNIFLAAQVEFAIMEPSGEINALLKNEYLPITPSHLGIKVSPESESQNIIMDGEIMDEALAAAGLSREWLNTELEKFGVSSDNVFVGQVDSYGQFNVDLYDDKLKVPQPQEKASLLAQLKKCEADLEMFALSSDNKKVKVMYGDCSMQLQQVIDQIRPILSQ